MADNKTKLAVAIPTYNGSRYIKEAIESIAVQIIGKYDDFCEIVVLDNCSTDATGVLVLELAAKYKFVKYFKNETNVGPDANFDLAVRRATGEYVWLLGDDDFIEPGGIERILNILKQNSELAYVFANYSSYEADLKICLRKYNVALKEERLFNSADEFYSTTTNASIVLSSNIVRREYWIKLDAKQYSSSNCVHFCMISRYLKESKNEKIFYVGTPYVRLRQGKALRWGAKELLIYTNKFIPVYRKMPVMGYSEKTVNAFLESTKRNLWRLIINAKRSGLNYDQDLRRKLIVNFGMFISFWFVDFIWYLIPGQVYRGLDPLYKKIKGI